MKHLLIAKLPLCLFSLAGMLSPAIHAQSAPFREPLRPKADSRLPAFHPVPGLTGSIKSIDSEWMDGLMQSWIAGFKRLQPGVQITSLKRDTLGALGVEPALTQGRITMAPASRELMPFEIEDFQKKFGYKPFGVKVALGSFRAPDRAKALAIYVNATNPIQHISLAQLDAIYCSTRKRGQKEEIYKWGQLGLTGEWADREILPIGTHQPEGTGNYLRIEACKDGAFKEGFHLLTPMPPVSGLARIIRIVAANPSAIGYGGFNNQMPGVKSLPIVSDDGRHEVSGTFESVTVGKYPLIRGLYIYVNRPPGEPLNPALKAFFTYVLSHNGQVEIEKDDAFLPLPDEIALEELRKLE